MQVCQVTVYCLAYNHAAYIRQTLEGFVRQRTDFPFQVLVHDDASTDGTQEIILEYRKRYPGLIVPILQKENQFSRGVKITRDIILPRVQTEYMAVCEGDDYWTDDMKLQLQYDYLQAHPECSLCVHDTQCISADGRPLKERVPGWTEDREITAEEVIRAGAPLFHTSSCMFRTQARREMPPEFAIPGVGDYPLDIWLATRGPVHTIARTMSAYRVGAQGSWTLRVMGDPQKAVAHYANVIAGLNRMDAMTQHAYHDAFAEAMDRCRFSVVQLQNHILPLLTDAGVRRVFMARPLGRRIRDVGGMLARRCRGFAGAIRKRKE